MSNLNEQQFLPGTEHMRPAEPHEQTEAQFHNRPDVMVHGRFLKHEAVHDLGFGRQLNTWATDRGFHSGTERAAHERVVDLGVAHPGYDETPRFFHGRVDPKQMHNRPEPAAWEGGSLGDDLGREEDQGEDWGPHHHNRYYRNDYEDEGSTSAIHGWTGGPDHTNAGNVPENFVTWRQSVADAQANGDKVPSHVQALYNVTGGVNGPHHVMHPHLPFETRTMVKPNLGSNDQPMFHPHGGERPWLAVQGMHGPV